MHLPSRARSSTTTEWTEQRPMPILMKSTSNSLEESRQKVAFDLSGSIGAGGKEECAYSSPRSVRSSYRRRSSTANASNEKPRQAGRIRSASDTSGNDGLERQEAMRLKRLSGTSKRSSQGSMKDLPPLPANHVNQIKRASNASTASGHASRCFLPQLELGDVSLGVPDELLSPTASEAASSQQQQEDFFSRSTGKRRSADGARPARTRTESYETYARSSLEVVQESPRSDIKKASRAAREETRRVTALWVSMLGDLDHLSVSTGSASILLTSMTRSQTPPVSPAASSDCLDPFLKAYLPTPSSYSSTHLSPASAFQSQVDRYKPLPPSPRLLSPTDMAFNNPFEASFASTSSRPAPPSSPRRASLPANVPSGSSVPSFSRSKSRPPPLNLLAPIADSEETVHTAIPYASHRSRSLPTNEGNLPTMSSTQTITQAYQSRLQQRRYRFPSSTAGADLSPTNSTANTSFERASFASYEMSRSRETSFSSTSGGSAFFSSDEDRSRRSSNFTVESSIPSPRSFTQEEEKGEVQETEIRTPKIDDEYVDEEDLTEVPGENRFSKVVKQHSRVGSGESQTQGKKRRDRTGSMKESPTLNIVMYGMAM